jgi:hypothetical protein
MPLSAQAEDLRLQFRPETNGVRRLSLFDSAGRERLLGSNQPPHFCLTLRQPSSKPEAAGRRIGLLRLAQHRSRNVTIS